ATSGSSTAGLLHSVDGGQNWDQIGTTNFPISGLPNNYWGAADVKFSSDGQNVFASVGPGSQGPGKYLIYSQDGGQSFTNV
ncbi:hypothetical protein ACTUQ0_15270, partial [Listeria monocytogenes]|uniref:hypothetical protein n=1 Tax=Listeria monocytogenes TaxID=1639 RepID=UPI003FA43B31